uniref:Uncharacterized protein n=1 Tax=Panagrolaimus sp. ES5 TaxID=591445 RepID=A0AC34GHG9_9BILA
MESEKKKLIYKFIRYVAHINGANIMTFSTTAESLVSKCKTLLSCYAFHEAKPSIQQNTDINKPLYINAGSDSLESIGHITGAGIPPSNYKDAMNEWKEAFQENFPQEDEAKKQSSSTDIVEDKKFAEYEIDIAVEEKRRELEMFIREKKNRKALAEKSTRQNNNG